MRTTSGNEEKVNNIISVLFYSFLSSSFFSVFFFSSLLLKYVESLMGKFSRTSFFFVVVRNGFA